PETCRAREVAQTIGGLFRAAHQRDANAIQRRLGPGDAFQWYSQTTVDGEQKLAHVVRRSPRATARLLVDRAREAGEHIRVVALEISYDSRRKLAHLSPLFRYRATHVANGRWRRGHGKGAIDCKSGGLIV